MRQKQLTCFARFTHLSLVALLVSIGGVKADEPAVCPATASSAEPASAASPEVLPIESHSSYSPGFTGGLRVHVDPQTGTLVAPPAKHRALELSPAMRRALSTSDQGLVEVMRPDGGVMVRLEGRFMSATYATIGDDGKVRVGHGLAPSAVPVQEKAADESGDRSKR